MNVMPHLRADARELGVLREEAVARVDGVGGGDLGGADDGRDVEVALARRRGPDAHGLVGEAHVERARVDLGVDGDGLDAELAARAQDAQRDLAAVGDEDLLEHRAAAPRLYAFLMRKSFCPNSTLLPFWAKISVDGARALGLDLVHQLHRLDDAERLPARTTEPTSTNGGASGDGER